MIKAIKLIQILGIIILSWLDQTTTCYAQNQDSNQIRLTVDAPLANATFYCAKEPFKLLKLYKSFEESEQTDIYKILASHLSSNSNEWRSKLYLNPEECPVEKKGYYKVRKEAGINFHQYEIIHWLEYDWEGEKLCVVKYNEILKNESNQKYMTLQFKSGQWFIIEQNGENVFEKIIGSIKTDVFKKILSGQAKGDKIIKDVIQEVHNDMRYLDVTKLVNFYNALIAENNKVLIEHIFDN